MVQLANLVPFVLSNVVDLCLAGCVIGVFGANRINVVLGLVLEASVEVRKLVATLAVLHRRTAFNLVRLFVKEQSIVGYHGSNLILLQFAPNQKNLILGLNAGEPLGHDLSIANSDGGCVLRGQFVHEHLLQLLVEIVQTGFLGLEDEVRLEREHIVQEASEFVDFTADLDDGPSVVLHEFAVALETIGEVRGFVLVMVQIALLLEYIEELGRLRAHFFLFLNQGFDLIFDC